MSTFCNADRAIAVRADMAFSLTFTALRFLLAIVNILIRQLYDIRCRCGYNELRKVRMDYLERFTEFLGPVPSPLGLHDGMFNSQQLSLGVCTGNEVLDDLVGYE